MISAKMSLNRFLLLVVLLCVTFSGYCLADVFTGNLSSLVWSTKNATTDFIAPYYHNVSTGNVWVLPSSKYDLGARQMTCQCFNPGEKCCMPASSAIGPFCIAQNATCCVNSYCNADETCCGGGCCPKLSTCIRDQDAPASCCPQNSTCSGPIKCIDFSSSNCVNSFDPTWIPPRNCCPASLPYCRDFPGSGPGCYASPTPGNQVVVSTTTSTEVDFVSILNLAVVTATTSIDQVTTIAKETLTLNIIPLGAGMFTYAFPSVTPTPGITVLNTVWEVDVLTSTLTLTLTETVKSSSKSQVPSSTRTVTVTSNTPALPTETSTTSKKVLTTVLGSNTTSSASPTPTICFNSDQGTLLPCISSSTSFNTSTAGDAFSPQGAVVFDTSQAKRSIDPKAMGLSVLVMMVMVLVPALQG